MAKFRRFDNANKKSGKHKKHDMVNEKRIKRVENNKRPQNLKALVDKYDLEQDDIWDEFMDDYE